MCDRLFLGAPKLVGVCTRRPRHLDITKYMQGDLGISDDCNTRPVHQPMIFNKYIHVQICCFQVGPKLVAMTSIINKLRKTSINIPCVRVIFCTIIFELCNRTSRLIIHVAIYQVGADLAGRSLDLWLSLVIARSPEYNKFS